MKIIFFFMIFLFGVFGISEAREVSFSNEQIQEISNKIFQNECSSKEELLVSWNEKEEFMSLGIGHFIWYPEKLNGNYTETFPEFIEYLKGKNIQMPEWLKEANVNCPWKSREDFIENQYGDKAKELRKFISETKFEQGYFIVQKMQKALPVILKNAREKDHELINKNYQMLTETWEGTFAVIDYINFKGLGIDEKERYKNKGWGLLQVLIEMDQNSNQPLNEFVYAANKILEERVKNSSNIHEQKWLKGWQNRINNYLKK